VVGHSYICYAPLLHGNTSILYEGKPVGTPDAAQFFRVIAEHGASALFTAPTALRAIRQVDPDGVTSTVQRKAMRRTLRNVFVAGEHCDQETLQWSQRVFGGVPVLDHWWQTESGWPISATCVGLVEKGTAMEQPPAGCAGRPVPGYNVKVIREGAATEEGQLGRIVVKLPLPPGFSNGLWRNEAKFREAYFSSHPGYYDTMDAGRLSADGHLWVMSREDDVINVAGHRLSSGALEEAILQHPALVECAVIGLPDQLKGHVPLALVVVQAHAATEEAVIITETIALVRRVIGAVASFKQVLVVKRLPKTRSGKVPRNTMAAMAAGAPFKIPITIEDATVYKDLKENFRRMGLEASDPTP